MRCKKCGKVVLRVINYRGITICVACNDKALALEEKQQQVERLKRMHHEKYI